MTDQKLWEERIMNMNTEQYKLLKVKKMDVKESFLNLTELYYTVEQLQVT